MITCTRTYTRPNISVPWHTDASLGILSEYVLTHITDTYRLTGQLISDSYEEAVDGLSTVYTATWSSIEDYDGYNFDSVLIPYWEERDVYNASVGIVMSPVEIV